MLFVDSVLYMVYCVLALLIMTVCARNFCFELNWQLYLLDST